LPPTIIMVIPLYSLQQIGWFSELYSLWKLAALVPLGAILYAISLRVFYREGFNRLLEMVRKKKK
jgi:putative peptidoglycan lipid II flippase